MQTEPRADIIRTSKYLPFIGILLVTVLMISNTIAVKIVQIGPFAISGATLIFPISYIFGDILTEVYGYKATRKVVWAGFFSLIVMSFSYWLVQILPSASFWGNQSAYEAILGSTPRIVAGSILAYFAGEFSNSFVLSRMKIWTNGKYLWTRTIGSTVVGEGVDSIIFFTIAFAGVLPTSALISIIITAYIFKVLYEVAITPVTYMIVAWFKRAEGLDVYDRGINYNPFLLKD